MNGVVVGVIQPRQVTPLERQVRLPVILSALTPRCSIHPIQLPGDIAMHVTQQFHQRLGSRYLRRTVGDEMIVVGQNGPGFQAPAVVGGTSQEGIVQQGQALRGVEEMHPIPRACRHEKTPGLPQPMRRSMRPVPCSSTGGFLCGECVIEIGHGGI